MLKLVKIFSFVAICTLASIAGAQIGGTYMVWEQECRNWKCVGETPQKCKLNGDNTIQTCFVPPGEPVGCEVEMFAWMLCEGEDEEEEYCSHWYNKCIHPVP
ncbi:MAG: hypothetical protein ACR2FY_09045 [Pirellulaceae bacterium]